MQRLSPNPLSPRGSSPKKASSRQQLRRRKRTYSHNKRSVSPPTDNKVEVLTPKNFFSTIEDVEKPPSFEQVRPAPAKELESVWDGFIEESRKRYSVSIIIKDLYRYPHLHQITVLNIERAGLDKIFEFLKPCKKLIALYLKGNRVITRDLV